MTRTMTNDDFSPSLFTKRTLKTNNCKVGPVNVNIIAANFVVDYFRTVNLRTKHVYNTFLLFIVLKAEIKISNLKTSIYIKTP